MTMHNYYVISNFEQEQVVTKSCKTDTLGIYHLLTSLQTLRRRGRV